MPVYDYIDLKTGRTVEFPVPIQCRDLVPGHKRIFIPRKLHVLRGTPDPTEPEQAVPKALRQMEDKEDHQRIARATGFSTKDMKEIWQIH